jgi:hypothetical protein
VKKFCFWCVPSLWNALCRWTPKHGLLAQGVVNDRQVAMDVLMRLHTTVMALRPRLPLASLVHDVPETILITTIRCMTRREHDWTRLCHVFGDAARKGKGEEPVVAQWAVSQIIFCGV